MREFDRQPNRRYDLRTEHDGNLSDLMDRCGHYYAHRIGGSRRGQSSVMAWLAYNPDATQKELAEALGIMPASLSEVLMKLERKGYVTREKDEADRRLVRVRLTEAGEKALEEPENTPDDPFCALSAEERVTLKELLAKLLADWQVRYIEDRKRAGDRVCPERPGRGRDFSLHGNEHPGHDGDHPNHGRNEYSDRRGHGNDRHGRG